VDRLCARLQCGLFQGCGAVAKMTRRTNPVPELMVFMSVAPSQVSSEISDFTPCAHAQSDILRVEN